MMEQLQSFKGIANNSTCVDLVIVDIPNNLVVPNTSMANGEVPTWNVEKARFLNTVFDFPNTHLQDDGAILLFHANNSQGVSKGLSFQDAQGMDGCQLIEDD
jgi:hypothetical protein